MKQQINWHLFNLSNNYLLRKKIDDCILLYDDKDYITFNIKYYQELLYITTHELPYCQLDLYDIFKTTITKKLNQVITYEDYYLAPLYFTETKEMISIVNIGIFIMSNFAFKCNNYYDEFYHCFMSLIKYGIEPTETDIEELKTMRYPELKADVDDVLYIKQAGFYFNLFKSFYYSYKNSLNKIYIKLPIESDQDIYIIDVVDIFKVIYPYWQKWQIIWRSNKYAITQFLKFKPLVSMSAITDDNTKKYRNIVFNQSLMSENEILKSICNFNNICEEDIEQKKLNTTIKENSKKSLKKRREDDSKDNLDVVIDKISKLNLRKESIKKDLNLEKQLTNYSRFSGSKHLHYLKPDKIKEKSILDMLKSLNIKN